MVHRWIVDFWRCYCWSGLWYSKELIIEWQMVSFLRPCFGWHQRNRCNNSNCKHCKGLFLKNSIGIELQRTCIPQNLGRFGRNLPNKTLSQDPQKNGPKDTWFDSFKQSYSSSLHCPPWFPWNWWDSLHPNCTYRWARPNPVCTSRRMIPRRWRRDFCGIMDIFGRNRVRHSCYRWPYWRHCRNNRGWCCRSTLRPRATLWTANSTPYAKSTRSLSDCPPPCSSPLIKDNRVQFLAEILNGGVRTDQRGASWTAVEPQSHGVVVVGAF